METEPPLTFRPSERRDTDGWRPGFHLVRVSVSDPPTDMQTFYQPRRPARYPPALLLDPALMPRHLLEDQVELWWSRDPCRSLLCYCASVVLVLGLGLGGVGLLSTGGSLSGEWRLGVGATLCLLALAVLLKQLLSSAVQDTGCVRSRRRIDQLRSGGKADPPLMFAVGLAVALCGTALLCVVAVGGWGHNGEDMFVSGLVLMAAGTAVALAVLGYGVFIHLRRRREQRRRRMMSRARRGPRSRVIRVVGVPGGQMGGARRETSSSRTNLI